MSNNSALIELTQSFITLGKTLKEYFQPYIDVFQEFQNFCREHETEIKQALSELQNSVKELHDFWDKDLWEKLKKYGWIIPGSLPSDIFGRLYQKIKCNLSDVDEQELFDKFFIEEFTKENWYYIKYLIQCWEKNPHISKDRLRILKDCFKVVKRYSYKTASNIVIPTIMAQVEGLLVDRFGKKFNMPQTDNFVAVARYLLCTQLYQRTTSGDNSNITNADFSRNKILHGENPHYGKIENVIKLYLLIETILNA